MLLRQRGMKVNLDQAELFVLLLGKGPKSYFSFCKASLEI